MLFLSLFPSTVTYTAAPEPKTVNELVDYYSKQYDVSRDVMHTVIKCESLASTTVQSFHKDPTGPNGREDSWGLVQIHLPFHPTVTREQATDPEFAIRFLAKNLSQGQGKLWTCYKQKILAQE